MKNERRTGNEPIEDALDLIEKQFVFLKSVITGDSRNHHRWQEQCKATKPASFFSTNEMFSKLLAAKLS